MGFEKILLIGSSQDPHVTILSSHVADLGGKPVILDPGSSENTVCISLRQGRQHLLLSSGEKFDCADFGAIWFRLKPVIPLPSWGPLEASAATFARGEWRTVLQGLVLVLPSQRWINVPEAQFAIASKVRQLSLAAAFGFTTPDTVITNDPEEVLGLFKTHKRVIYKGLNAFVFPDQTGILTTEISEKEVVEKRESIKRAPGIYQEFIEKQYELRVTIVGNQIFPALVRTPSAGAGAIDWRHDHFEDIFETCSIDDEVADRLLQFHHKAGLTFGAYDLIADLNGRHVFLECNPGGQFLWLENKLGLPIMNAIAKELMRVASVSMS